MSSYQQNIGVGAPGVVIHGEHVDLYCIFSTGGTAVNVDSPQFTMTTTGGTEVAIPSDRLLVPFSKDGPEVGRYHVTFLAGDWLTDGTYTVTMTGQYGGSGSGSTITATASFVIRQGNSIQSYIEMVRSALRDSLPQLYEIDDPDRFFYSDGDLYGALTRALNSINMTKPSKYTFTMEGIPWPTLLIDGAVIYALHSKQLVEIANTFTYNDEISFAINRAQSYQSAAQLLYAQWVQEKGRVKQDYAFGRARPIGLGHTRIPFTVQRIFSMAPHMLNTFGSNTGPY